MKPQKGFKGQGKSAGSYNFGVVQMMGIRSEYYQSFNVNMMRAPALHQACRASIWDQVRTKLNELVPQWRSWEQAYLQQCPDIPPLKVNNDTLPWNGEQLNVFYASARHCDRTDARGMPCLITFCGTEGGTVRIHGKETYIDVETKPGGMLLFDTTFDHEVLAAPGAVKATKGNGTFAPGRVSCVWMANRQLHEFKPPEWIQEKLRVQYQKRTSGHESPSTRKRARQA